MAFKQGPGVEKGPQDLDISGKIIPGYKIPGKETDSQGRDVLCGQGRATKCEQTNRRNQGWAPDARPLRGLRVITKTLAFSL